MSSFDKESALDALASRTRFSLRLNKGLAAVAVATGISLGFLKTEPVELPIVSGAALLACGVAAAIDDQKRRETCGSIVARYHGETSGFGIATTHSEIIKYATNETYNNATSAGYSLGVGLTTANVIGQINHEAKPIGQEMLSMSSRTTGLIESSIVMGACYAAATWRQHNIQSQQADYINQL